MWHPLGATGSQLVSYLDLDEMAEDIGAVVVVPEAIPTRQ